MHKPSLPHRAHLARTTQRHGPTTQAAKPMCRMPCAQAAALGGDLGGDGELAVPALLESEDPASVLVVRVRAACMF